MIISLLKTKIVCAIVGSDTKKRHYRSFILNSYKALALNNC